MAKINIHTGYVAPTPKREWSILQKNIFDAVQNTQDNILIQARAGSGKTTTLLECARRLPVGQKILFMAFNKAIVEDLSNKLPLSIDCCTLHSLAYHYCKRGMDKFCAVNQWKVSMILKECLNMEDEEEKKLYYEYRKPLAQVVGLAKANNMQVPLSSYQLLDLWSAIEVEDIPSSFSKIYRHLEADLFNPRVNGKRYEIDFDDMLYLAVNCGYVKPQYDCIFVDEAQDISAIQREFIKLLLKPGGRVIITGDEYQAIYGFRGASYNSLDFFKAAYSCVELPLSISYRCPSSVIKEANRFVTDITSDSGVGTVGLLHEKDVKLCAKAGDLVVCRYNKPLTEICITLLAAGIPSYILGDDIHEYLLKHIQKLQKIYRSHSLTEKDLQDYYEMEADMMTNEWKKAFLKDVTDTLCTIIHSPLCKQCGIEAAIEKMFQNKDGAVICSTIHKAKGLEADSVFFLAPETTPSEYAQQVGMQQEYNLIYVAITRAKKNLYYVTEKTEWEWRK